MKTIRKYIQQLKAFATKYGDDTPVVRKKKWQQSGKPVKYSMAIVPKVIYKDKKPSILINPDQVTVDWGRLYD
jgi:hypothetical protein